MNTKIEIQDRDVTEAFNRLLAMGENPAPALDAIGRLLKSKLQLGFITSTDPYGRPWAPLKTRQGLPLRDKGHLMNSIDYRVEGASVEVGTNLPYAPTHQFGAVIEAKGAKALRFFVNGKPVFVGRGHKITIPAREMFPTEGLPPDWAADSLDVIGEVLRRAWRG